MAIGDAEQIEGARARGATLLAAVLAMLATLVVVTRADAPPDPKGLDAAPTEFSAARARAVLARVLADEAPHPLGSPAQSGVRRRVIAELEALGLATQEQVTLTCRGSTCGWVHNVLARIEGAAPGPAVLVAVHHDSVPAGPGASDDGSGVAIVLELARALLAGPPPPRPVLLLVDDGEEVGLLGAQAFVDAHPWATEVGVVINLEARGSRGPSMMFETHGANGWLVDALARELPDPAMTSLAAAVYAMLPNGTDLTVFAEAGWPAVNFAFSDGVEHYHTPLDDLDHLDDRSLQHQGDNALGAVHALAAGPVADPPPDELVYVDALRLGVLRWPVGWVEPLSWGLAVVWLLVVAWGWRRGRARPARVVGLVLAMIVAVLLAGALGFAIDAAVGMARGGVAPMFEARPWPLRIAVWTAGAIAVVGPLAYVRHEAELALAACGVWVVAALVVAHVLPAASPVVWPAALVGSLVAVAVVRRGAPARWAGAAIAFGVATTLVTGRLLLPFEATLGFLAAPGLAALVALVVLPIVPLAAAAARTAEVRRATWAIGLAGVLGGSAVAMAMPVGTPEHPIGLDLVRVHDRGAGTSQWVAAAYAQALPAALAEAGLDPVATPVPGSSWPWSMLKTYPGSVDSLDPDVDPAVLVGAAPVRGSSVLRARVVPAPGILGLELFVPQDVAPRAVWVDGQRVPELREVTWRARDGSTRRYLRVWVAGMPESGFDLAVDAGAPGSWVLRSVAMRYGAPQTEAAAALRRARPDWAVPFQWGDVEVTYDEHVMGVAPTEASAGTAIGREGVEQEPEHVRGAVDALGR